MNKKGQAGPETIILSLIVVAALVIVGGLVMHTLAEGFHDDFRSFSTDTTAYTTTIAGTTTVVDYSTTNLSIYDSATLNISHEIDTGAINVSTKGEQIASITGTSPTEVTVDSKYLTDDSEVSVTYSFDSANSNVTSANLTYTQYTDSEYGGVYTSTTGNLTSGLNLMTIVLILLAAGGLISAIYGFVMR